MKKLISLLLALTLAMGLVACGNTDAPETTGSVAADTQESIETPEPNDATNIMTAIWNEVAEDKKFPAMGGDMSAMVDSAPGNYSLEDEGMTTVLYVPAEQLENIDQASSLMHMMMANHFTGGVFHMVDGGDAAAFADAMKASFESTQWICGTPEKMLIAVINGEYVLAAFGLSDNIDALQAGLSAAYADAQIKYTDAILG